MFEGIPGKRLTGRRGNRQRVRETGRCFGRSVFRMSCNLYEPHLIVVAEDKATYDFAAGLCRGYASYLMKERLSNDDIYNKFYQILNYQRGWHSVVEVVKKMPKNICRRVLLVIDLDKKTDRISSVKQDLKQSGLNTDRIFVIGPHREIENLRQGYYGNLKEIGENPANHPDCDSPESDWNHQLLRECAEEAKRLCKDISDHFEFE